LVEVFELATSGHSEFTDEKMTAMCGFAADALGWVLRDPTSLHPMPFESVLKQLDEAEGNTPN
jgi:hypothetical protein